MPFTESAKNTMLDALPSPVYFTLHTENAANDEDTGNEFSGDRVSANLTAASGASREIDGADPVLTVPGGTSVSSVSIWDSDTGGTMLAREDVTTESFANQGTYTINAATTELLLNGS